MSKILVFSSNPPKSYVNALDFVKLKYDCLFAPTDFSPYDGLLLTGGGDVLPAFYNGDLPSKNVNVLRDAAEFNAVKYFTEKGLPILGVCRGAQILNVYFGGKLNVVDGHTSNRGDVYHKVESVGREIEFPLESVNSAHRQSCRPLAENAKPQLVANDGVIEAFTINSAIIAVQFHPERMGVAAITAVYGKFAKMINAAKRVLPTRA